MAEYDIRRQQNKKGYKNPGSKTVEIYKRKTLRKQAIDQEKKIRFKE